MRRAWRWATYAAVLGAILGGNLSAQEPSASDSPNAISSTAARQLGDADAESVDPQTRRTAVEQADADPSDWESVLPAAKPPIPKPYKSVFYDNDFSYLEQPGNPYHSLGDSLKRIHLGECLWFDVGGEYRLRQQNESILNRSDNFLLQRFRLYGDIHYSDWFRAYGEMIDAQRSWGDLPPRASEVNRFDALNLFGDVKFAETDAGKFWLRAGRQEMFYGNQRLVARLEWSNTRRAFDGVKAFYRSDDWDVDSFWTRPVLGAQHLVTPHAFDHPESHQEFYGVYATRKNLGSVTADVYFLRYAGTEPLPSFGYSTFGSRLEGHVEQWLWEVEGGHQFGNYLDATQDAGFYTLGLGRKLVALPWKPVFWAYYDWASGDRYPGDRVHGTFNQLFPLGHRYLGYMDIVGRQNIEDLNFQFTVNPTEKVEFLVWYHIFKLQQARDGLYNSSGTLIRIDPSGAAGQDVGQELDWTIKIAFSPRTEMLLGYSHLFPGPFLLHTAGGAPGKDFYYTQFAVRF